MCGAFILYSFVSFDRPYALKIKYPMIVSFSHTYLQATMCNDSAPLLYHSHKSMVQISLKSLIGHFSVVGLVSLPLSECEAELVLIQTPSFSYGN